MKLEYSNIPGADFTPVQALLEVNSHMADLRKDAGKGEEEGDVLEVLPVQLLFGKLLDFNHTRLCRCIHD